jgi:DNA-binding NtrC family response regulator
MPETNGRSEEHITLISEDAHYARLLQRYLERRSLSVEVLVVGRQDSLDGGIRRAMEKSRVLLLDMGWFEASRQELYQTLIWLCTVVQVPRVLLVDASWPEAWVRRFGTQSVLKKPFSMDQLGGIIAGATGSQEPDAAS